MGDTYCNIVLDNVDTMSDKAIADIVVQHLIARKIISASLTDCVLGQDSGYPPAENYWQVLEDGDQRFPDDGVEVNLGRRIFYSAGVDEINCPNCNENIVALDWGSALDEWMNETGNDKIVCPGCSHSYSISEYKFDPNWAFGNIGFTFWNWGSDFKRDFIDELEQLTGYKIKVVYGKL